MKATSSRSSVLLLLLLASCKQILGLDEGSVAKDAPLVEDVAVADMAIDDACKDTDLDGVCNVDDTWPCGAEPANLPTTVTWSTVVSGDVASIELTDATLDGVTKLVVEPGAKMELTARYLIIDCICPACLDQIEVGFAPAAGRQGCIYAGNPAGSAAGACTSPTLGTGNLDLIAPLTPGAYTVRFKLGQGNQCGTQTTWWEGTEPPASSSVVHVCVAAPAP